MKWLAAFVVLTPLGVGLWLVALELRDRKRRKRAHMARLAEMEFWSDHIMIALRNASKAVAIQDWAAYEKARSAYYTNVHRYETDVMGWK